MRSPPRTPSPSTPWTSLRIRACAKTATVFALRRRGSLLGSSSKTGRAPARFAHSARPSLGPRCRSAPLPPPLASGSLPLTLRSQKHPRGRAKACLLSLGRDGEARFAGYGLGRRPPPPRRALPRSGPFGPLAGRGSSVTVGRLPRWCPGRKVPLKTLAKLGVRFACGGYNGRPYGRPNCLAGRLPRQLLCSCTPSSFFEA